MCALFRESGGNRHIQYQKSVTACLVSGNNLPRPLRSHAPWSAPPDRSALRSRDAALASALAGIFRGRFCDILLRDRVALPFAEGAVIYDLGATQRALWFVRRGVVKVGTITADGREIIYDVRKDGDVVGELCAFEPVRRDRAVVVEQADLVSVPLDRSARCTGPASGRAAGSGASLRRRARRSL